MPPPNNWMAAFFVFGGKGEQTSMFNEKEAAEKLGCSVAALRKWRLLGSGPAYVKVGRLVRYRETDLLAYLDAHCVQPVGGGR